MSRKDGILRVVLTGKWFDMIASGEKREEYRGQNWDPKFLVPNCFGHFPEGYARRYLGSADIHPYHTLVASRGYTSRTLSRPIKRIRWGTPRPEWSGDTVAGDCFIIELDLCA